MTTTGDVPDTESVYASLLENIQYYNQHGDVLLQGDFNAYTNVFPDYIISDKNQYPETDDHYLADSAIPRNNMDNKRTNKSGKSLLNICKETGLKLVNGRSMGDIFGNFTCFTYNGCSLVDYAVASAEMFNKIAQFRVHALTSLSDHCAISCSIMCSGIKVNHTT